VTVIHPLGWKAAKGYANGFLAPAGRFLAIAGQIAWDAEQRMVGAGDFVAQFEQALANVAAVVAAAGGSPEHLISLTIYVTDKELYRCHLTGVGAAYRRILGKHFPAMALVEVRGLVEAQALVEIQGLAVIP
jgi:enamine deaminase RidA (YjgF/YER057c/UK114 family)